MQLAEKSVAKLLLVVGAFLLANPLYLDRVLAYNYGFQIGDLYYAAISGLGFAAALGGLALAADLSERYDTSHTMAGIGFAAVLLFVAYTWAVAGVISPEVSRGLGRRDNRPFVAAGAVALFLGSAALIERRPRDLIGAVAALGTGLLFAAITHGDLLDPWQDFLAVVALSNVVFPGSGGLLYLAAIGLGSVYGTTLPAPTPERDRRRR